MKTQHLELILTALAESVEKARMEHAKDVNAHLETIQHSMDRLYALWEIKDVLDDDDKSKREKLLAIAGIVDVALNPDMGTDDDWGYQ